MRATSPGLGRLADRLDHAEALDRIAVPVHDALEDRLSSGPLGEVLRGRWLGHPAHPMLTDVPIGCWTSAWLLDVFGDHRSEPAADAFVGLGALAALPTVMTGWADWTQLPAPARRTGVVHAGANAVATALYAGSWFARRSGNRRLGVRLAHTGAAVATVGGFLGGHLAFRAEGTSEPDEAVEPTPTPTEAPAIGESSP